MTRLLTVKSRDPSSNTRLGDVDPIENYHDIEGGTEPTLNLAFLPNHGQRGNLGWASIARGHSRPPLPLPPTRLVSRRVGSSVTRYWVTLSVLVMSTYIL